MTTPRLTMTGMRASALGAMLIACAGSAWGQVGSGGRALDRNLHAYDGRYNAAAPRVEDQVRLNNALITGNVTGGRAFQGYVGYRAPEEFGAPLGSNDLYSFRRDSALSAISGLNIRPSDALRYQFALSTGQAPPSYLAKGVVLSQRSGASTPITTTPASTSAAALRATSEYLTGQSIRPALVGSRIDAQGYELTAKASPLMGIDWVRSENPVVLIERPEDKLAAEDLGATIPKDPRDLPTIDPKRTIPETTGSEPRSSRVPSPLDREAMVERLGPPGLRIEPVSPVYAQVLDSFRADGKGGETSDTGERRSATDAADPNNARANSDNVRSTEPFDNSLDAQLERLRKRMQPAATARAETWKPISEEKKPESKSTDEPSESTDLGDILSGRKKDDKPASDSAIISRVYEKPERELTAAEKLTPELTRALRNSGNILVERLSRLEMPAVKAANQPAYQAAMDAGQRHFAAGEYFDAEDAYTRALAAMAGDPMARVGRIHSQLGAGLYLSGATNLRRLFADHPEMIGAKYASALTPPPERANKIVTQLREEMARGSSALGRDAALLLGYVGHLRNDPALVADGLSEMSRRFDPDNEADQALLAACRAAWMP